jgi:hypothetical protein
MKEFRSYPDAQDWMSEKDVTEISEIFHTPLTGHYNWDYDVADNRLNKLYQLAKKRQWNVEIDLDWDIPYDARIGTLEDYHQGHDQMKGYEPYAKLSEEQQLDFQKKLSAWAIGQFLHGEQGALMVASQLVSCAPTYNAKLYAATQVFDEARHVEAFNKYIQVRQGIMPPIGADLKHLLDTILTDERWDLKFIGMQLIIEGLALSAFRTFQQIHPDPLMRQMLEYIIKDEARHVTFGINYLENYVKSLPQDKIEERARFAFEACAVMRTRLHATGVYEHFGFDVEDACAYVAETAPIRMSFQEHLFQKVIPNLKKVGLLTESIRPDFEKLGVLKWEDLPNDGDIDWKEMKKPLKSSTNGAEQR